MKILYIANHGQVNSNDDEGAITYTLRQLGHEVDLANQSAVVHESDSFWDATARYDLCLFHKWSEPELIRWVRCRKAFWYFDLVDFPDPLIQRRCLQRIDWMRTTIPLVDLGFCTDGDWVDRWPSEKLVWLTQGADERVVGRGAAISPPICDVLFTGTVRGGLGRESFVADLRSRYGSRRFYHVQSGVHGRKMADLIASSRIVVAPDSPVTNRYWSNRVYNVLGFGGFLLHPYSKGLVDQVGYGRGVVYYASRKDLYELVDLYLGPLKSARWGVAESGIETVRAGHLYRHRVESLIRTCQERLGCPS